MKLTKSSLKQIIKEEIKNLTEEDSIETIQSEIAAEVEDMEYQDAINHLQRMFRAMQNVMMDITPGVPDSDGMDIEDEEVVMEQDDKHQQELIDAIKGLSKKFDELDLSIDFLAAIMSGESAARIKIGQAALGRAARPGRIKDSK